jgi:hypothetical protein
MFPRSEKYPSRSLDPIELPGRLDRTPALDGTKIDSNCSAQQISGYSGGIYCPFGCLIKKGGFCYSFSEAKSQQEAAWKHLA